MGRTAAGRAWALKALHPSEEVGEVVGVPDQCLFPVVATHYTQVVTLSAPPQVTGSWECEIYPLSEPTRLASYFAKATDNTHSMNGCWINESIGGNPTAVNIVEAFTNEVEAWRLMYSGVTVLLDANALSNQGSVVACQSVARPRSLGHPTLGPLQTAPFYTVAAPEVIRYQPEDTPEYNIVMMQPGSMSGAAADGVYMPIKLDSNHVEWHDARDVCFQADMWETAGVDSYEFPVAGVPSGALYAGAACAYPSGDEENCWLGTRCLRPCTNNIGAICFRNLAPTAALKLTFRTGFEYQITPGNGLMPYVKQSPPLDRQALDYYYAVSGYMRDAYPASFNDLDTMWKVISTIAGIVAPAVREIPFVGPALVEAGKAVGKTVASALKERKDRGVAKKQQQRKLKAAPKRS
jgi:hypothetical protein